MSIWRPEPVSTKPVLYLSQWNVFQTETGERHLCGVDDQTYEGRVSQAIGAFDPDTMSVRSASGRTYILVGPPGYSQNAEYVKSRWLDINNVVEYTEVTEEYDPLDPTKYR